MAVNGTLKHIRVDQVGSLVPDARWRDAVERYKLHQATADEVSAAQDASIRDAIAMHGGEALLSANKFFQLSHEQRQRLISFLRSLTAPDAAANELRLRPPEGR